MLIVCTSDWHLRPDKPICRKESAEEWINVQFRKLEFILDYAKKKDAPIYFGGDLSHIASDWPTWFLLRVIRLFYKYETCFWGVPGQHDLPFHDEEKIELSNFNMLKELGFIQYPFPGGYSFGTQISPTEDNWPIVIHTMVLKTENDEIYPGQLDKGNGQIARRILMNFPNIPLVVTGDNHIPFILKYKDRVLINSGSLTRQRSSENHAPGFYTYDTDTKEVKRVTIPHRKDVIIQPDKSLPTGINSTPQNPEILSLIESMDKGIDINYLDFLKSYFVNRNTRKEVQEIILKAGGFSNG